MANLKILWIKIERRLIIAIPLIFMALIWGYLIFGQRKNTFSKEFGRWEMFQDNIANNCMIQFSNSEGFVFENFALLGLKNQFQMKKSDFRIKSPGAVEKFIQKVCAKAKGEQNFQSVLFVQAKCEKSGSWIQLFEKRAVCE